MSILIKNTTAEDLQRVLLFFRGHNEIVELFDHGDLVDRDRMLEDLKYDIELDAKTLDDTDIVGAERARLQFDKDCKQNYMLYLTEQTVVIPAERSDE